MAYNAPVIKVVAFGLLTALAPMIGADAFADRDGCHCVHAPDDPTPCPCPLHRHSAVHTDEMPCPMHHAKSPLSGPGMRAGCGQGTPQLGLTVLFNWTPPASTVELAATPAAHPAPAEPVEVVHRPPHPPPRRDS